MSQQAKTRHARRIDVAHVVSVWVEQHIQAFAGALGQALRNPLNSVLTTAVIGISLALPAAFYLVLVNAQQVAGGWGGSARITLFLKMDVEQERARAVLERLEQRADIESVQFVSREEALAEYQRMSGFAEALDALEENPLPAMLLVQPRADTAAVDALLTELRALDEVDTGQFDRQWVQRLFAIMEILERAVLILATLLALAVLLIIGNTIRLAILNRRIEIEVNKLFGATNAFIQRPFLYSGMIHGLAGAALAWLLVTAAILLLAGPARRLAELYLSGFTLRGLGLEEGLWLLAAGALLGLAGSWFAVQRHLRDSAPF